MLRLFVFCWLFNSFSVIAQQQVQSKYLAGRTAGILPNLEYGLGVDRLGGAKMTFLDTGIAVKVVDSTIINYKIQLSKNHFAYLPKINFLKDSTLKLQNYYLTGNILINGDSIYDYVNILLDEKLPYRSIQQLNPSRIVVDIYGSTSNTNWITHRTSALEIKNVYYEQTEDDVYRLTIELKNEQHWGYNIYYLNNKLIIKVKRQPEDLSLDKLKIAIDAGHGGDNEIVEEHHGFHLYKVVYTVYSPTCKAGNCTSPRRSRQMGGGTMYRSPSTRAG